MWICILVGVRGHFKSIFIEPQLPIETKLESAAVIIKNDRVAHFFDFNVKKEKLSPVAKFYAFLYSDFIPLRENISFSVFFIDNNISDHVNGSSGLRAPPFYSFI